MPLNIREATTREDCARVCRVWSDVYRRGEPISDIENAVGAGKRAVLAELDGQAVGAYQAIALPTMRGSSRISLAGIAAVAVLPEHRVHGIGGAMMRSSLDSMVSWGYSVAALYPFRASYYRNFGYEITGARYEIRCPQARLPNLKSSMPVRRIEAGDVFVLNPTYENFMKSFSGGVVRDEASWKSRLGSKPPMIYAIGDPICAYAWTAFEGEFWQELRIGEIAWTTPESYRELLALIGGLTINRSEAVWYEPSNSPFLTTFFDAGVRITLERPVMYRVLDVPAALRELKPQADGEFSLSVIDDLRPSNLGPWSVRFGPGGVVVTPTQTVDLEMDIRHFSQAFMGQPSLDDLCAQGLVKVHNEARLRSATALLQPSPVMCTEFF